jgi:methionine synthase I (cobalamin-dependent)
MSNILKSKMKVMDGGMGTFLIAHGIPLDACFAELNLTRPSLISEIHKSYLAAGAEAIVSNTFGANRPRLAAFGAKKASLIEKINRAGITIAKEAAGKRPVFASIGPLGVGAKKMTPSEMFRHFKEQALFLEKEKPYGYLIETMPFLTQAEAATAAVREVSKRLILSSITFPRGLDDASGETVELIAQVLREAGANVIGVNCGSGPEESYAIFRALSLVDPGPFCVRPAAGLPGNLCTPQEFADWGKKFKKLRVAWFGGCCGTTPEYIRALASKLSLD